MMLDYSLLNVIGTAAVAVLGAAGLYKINERACEAEEARGSKEYEVATAIFEARSIARRCLNANNANAAALVEQQAKVAELVRLNVDVIDVLQMVGKALANDVDAKAAIHGRLDAQFDMLKLLDEEADDMAEDLVFLMEAFPEINQTVKQIDETADLLTQNAAISATEHKTVTDRLDTHASVLENAAVVLQRLIDHANATNTNTETMSKDISWLHQENALLAKHAIPVPVN